MTLTKKKMQKMLSHGDTVYVIFTGEAIPAKVLKITDDSIETDVDTLFFDEHRVTWMFTKTCAEAYCKKG